MKELNQDYVEGIGDPTERTLGLILLSFGLQLYEVEPISVSRKQAPHLKKRCTVPDFLVVKKGKDPKTHGVYVETTRSEHITMKKKKQKKVIRAAGLEDRYIRIKEKEFSALKDPKSFISLDLWAKLG